MQITFFLARSASIRGDRDLEVRGGMVKEILIPSKAEADAHPPRVTLPCVVLAQLESPEEATEDGFEFELHVDMEDGERAETFGPHRVVWGGRNMSKLSIVPISIPVGEPREFMVSMWVNRESVAQTPLTVTHR